MHKYKIFVAVASILLYSALVGSVNAVCQERLCGGKGTCSGNTPVSCGYYATCSTTYDENGNVTGCKEDGSNYCSDDCPTPTQGGSNPTNTPTPDPDPDPDPDPRYYLTIQKLGNCAASSTTNPTSRYYDDGTNVIVEALPAANCNFDNWTGCDSVSGANCMVNVGGDRTVSATFSLKLTPTPTFTPTPTPTPTPRPPVGAGGRVTVIVTGNGRVTDAAARISCPGDCVESYSAPTSVRLTLTPDAGMSLISVSGCDNITGNRCDVYLGGGRDAYVYVDFTRPPTPTFTPTPTPNSPGGGGPITSTPTPTPTPTITPTPTPVCNNNQIQDNGETGVDCGGGGCPSCSSVSRDLTLEAQGPGNVNYVASGYGTGSVYKNTIALSLLNNTYVTLDFSPLANARVATLSDVITNINECNSTTTGCSFYIQNPRRQLNVTFSCNPGYVEQPDGSCGTCGNGVCDLGQGETGSSCSQDCRTITVPINTGNVRYTNEAQACASGFPTVITQNNLQVKSNDGSGDYACERVGNEYRCYASNNRSVTVKLNNTPLDSYAVLFSGNNCVSDEGNSVTVAVASSNITLPYGIHFHKANSVKFDNATVKFTGSSRITPFSSLCTKLGISTSHYYNTGIVDSDVYAPYRSRYPLPLTTKITLQSFRDYKRSKGYNPVAPGSILNNAAYKDGAVNIITGNINVNPTDTLFWNAVMPSSEGGRVVYLKPASGSITLPSYQYINSSGYPFVLMVDGTVIIPPGVDVINGIIVAQRIELQGDINPIGLVVNGNLIAQNSLVQNRAVSYDTDINPASIRNICSPALYVNVTSAQYLGALQMLSTYEYNVRQLN